MRTADVIGLVLLIGYLVVAIVCAVTATRQILAEKGDDAFGTPMRHRWDIPLMALVFGPLFWVFFSTMDAIDWCWKKLVG